MKLRALAKEAYPELVSAVEALPDVSVRGVECDSRKVKEGFLFVAVRGVKQDGAGFAAEAVKNGAVAVVGEEPPAGVETPFFHVPQSRDAAARFATVFYGRPAAQLRCIGITGTNGKTTSSYLLEHLLIKEGARPGVLGTINYRFAGQETPAIETTPGPIRIQEMLARMLLVGCDHAVMEVSSHALDQGRAGGIPFRAALFTNFTQDHLDHHKTLEAYFECKAKLFTGLDASAVAVLNADDAWAMKLPGRTSARVVTYGMAPHADFRADSIKWYDGRTYFRLSENGKQHTVILPMIGTHNVYNAIGAVATLSSLGHDVGRLCESLADFAGVPGRLESIARGQDFLIFVDFAHTPDGLENVLKSLRPYKKGKLITVFGCGGDRDRGKRPQMARIAAELSDWVCVTSDNPRSEDPRAIVQEIVSGFPESFRDFTTVLDRSKAIRQALLKAREGDIVLLAGKGHERTQIIGDRVIPFNDREEAEKVLSGH